MIIQALMKAHVPYARIIYPFSYNLFERYLQTNIGIFSQVLGRGIATSIATPWNFKINSTPYTKQRFKY